MEEEFYTVRGYQLLEQNKKIITSAMEDYLEMIYRYNLQNGFIRINKLAQLLNVRASSTTKMIQKLGSLGLLKYEKYGVIILSDKGKDIGKFLLERHNIINEFLELLGSGEDHVLVQTELLEHNLTTNTVQNLDNLNSFLRDHPEIYEQYKEYKK